MRSLAYFSDVEGRWEKLDAFARGTPLVCLDGDRLDVADDAVLVFGGDAIDRGPHGRRVLRTLLDAKERSPDRVVLLAGNRDINKLRLRRELAGHPPRRTPPEVARAPRGELLRWIFANTMGARDAFAMRAAELASTNASTSAPSDDEVVESFVADVARDGLLTRYLARCQLAFRSDETLLVHGAVTDESLGVVPGRAAIDGVDAWIEALNRWYDESVDAYRSARDDDAYAALVAYQAPIPGTRQNQPSVVYGRLADATNNPHLPSPTVIARLRASGVARLVVGHTPCGDAPAILRDEGFELVCADNSYGRLESGSRIVVRGRELAIAGRARLDDGRDVDVRADLSLDDAGPIGARDTRSGHLVACTTADGAYLYRGLDGFRVEQTVEPIEAARARPLAPPRFKPLTG